MKNSFFGKQIRLMDRAKKLLSHRLDLFQDFKIISQTYDRGQNTAIFSSLLFFLLPLCLPNNKTALQRHLSQVWTTFQNHHSSLYHSIIEATQTLCSVIIPLLSSSTMMIVNILEGWEAQWDAAISALLPCQCKRIFTWLETFTSLHANWCIQPGILEITCSVIQRNLQVFKESNYLEYMQLYSIIRGTCIGLYLFALGI